MKKLYCIAPFPEDATSYYRAMGVMDHVATLFNGTLAVEKHRKEDNLRSWLDLQSADVLFVQRPATRELLNIIQYYKQVYERPVWVDYDDNLFEVPEYNHSRHFYNPNNESYTVMVAALKIADVITVSTQALKEYIERELPSCQGKVEVVPNAFPDVYIPIKRRKVVERKPICFWRGGQTHTGDLDFYAESIIKLIEEHKDVTFMFAGTEAHLLHRFTKYGNVQVLQGMDPNLYYLNLQRVGARCIMVPLVYNEFNRAKSNVAFIEGTWAGMQVVAPDMPEWQKSSLLYDEMGTFYECVDYNILNYRKWTVELAWQYICDTLLLSNVNKKRVKILKNLL